MSVQLEDVELGVVHVQNVHELHLAAGGHHQDLVRAEVGALQEPELARLHQTLTNTTLIANQQLLSVSPHLYRVDGSQDPEIVDHQEPVHGLEVAVSLREAAGDQVVAVHVEV